MSWEYWTPEPEPGLSLDLCATCNAVKVSSAQQVAEMQAEVQRLLNKLADERTESMRLRARVTELEGQHKGLVLNNAILRERPDLPLNRIPAARAMTKLYEDNERLRAALEVFACDCEGKAICLGNCMHRNARAALEGK